MHPAAPTADLPPPPDPPQDRTRPVPPHIADVLTLLHILLVYGRHLALTLDRRAAAGRFAVIAQFFGTARLPVIQARLARGLLRVQALQRVLLARARRGRDLVWLKPRPPRSRTPRRAQPHAADPPAEPAPRPAPVRRPDPDAAPDPDALPTLAQLEAEIRRHPIGRALAAICRDFGVSPGLCERPFFNALFDVLTWYRGDVAALAKAFRRRATTFDPEWDRDPRLGHPDRSAEAVRNVLGFFIGERWPVLPSPLPAPFRMPEPAETGPP